MTRTGILTLALLTLALTFATAADAAETATRATARNGDFSAYVKVRVGDGRVRTTAVITRGAARRVIRRVAIAGVRARRELRGTRLLLSSRGDLAVAVRMPSRSHRLVVAAVGKRARILVRDGEVSRLALEDDRTFSWVTLGSIGAVDLPYRAVPGQCPHRTGFAVVSEVSGTSASQREYTSPLDGRYGTMVRACDTASGTDRVIESVAFGFSGGDSLTTLGVYGGSIVLLTYEDDRYDGCFDTKIEVREVREDDIRGGVPTTTWRLPDCGVAVTGGKPRGPLVVTIPRKQVAWVQPAAEGVRLVATSPDGKLRELDPLGPSAITDLRADGETIRWTRDGVERSAAL